MGGKQAVAKVIFEQIARDLELLVDTGKGEPQRGRLTLNAIHWRDGDFILTGTGHASKQAHQFPLMQIKEITDLASGERVNVPEFRAELETHLG